MTTTVTTVPAHHSSALFIGGEWTAPLGSSTIQVSNPATGVELATIPEASAADADLAVNLAKEAFESGPWAKATPAERGLVLSRVVELLEKRSDELIELIVTDLGSARAFASYVHNHVIETWRSYAEMAKTLSFEQIHHGVGASVLVRKEPVGTVVAVVPWNGPMVLAAMKIAPALLAGCSVIVKPAPETPLSSLILADILSEAGLPNGVVSILPGGLELGKHLVAHPDVDMISFTGGTEAGKAVMRSAADRIARLTLELGGKSAAIILDDALPESVLPGLAPGMLGQSGQVCTALTRILVSEKNHDLWIQTLKQLFESQVVGDPNDSATTFGPLISQQHFERVKAHIDNAVADGATIVTGGDRPAGLDGNYMAPTLIDNVTPDMRIAQDEVFGPVYAVMTYRDIDEAVRLANDSDFGLSGAVYTSDVELGYDIASRIRTGTYSVNYFGADLSYPFGGFKRSGLGREGGEIGLDSFLEVKQIKFPAGSIPAKFDSTPAV